METKKKSLKKVLLLFLMYWVAFSLIRVLVYTYVEEKPLFFGWQRTLASSWISALLFVLFLKWQSVKTLFKNDAGE